MAKINIFISYSHTDEDLLDELKTHLATLQRERLLDTWTDRQILPGDERDVAIEGQLEGARVVLLLVSADFVASKYCYEIEMERALARHEEGAARVIPVILRPCNWRPMKFGKLAALPRDGRPVTKWENKDDAWLDVVQGLRTLLTVPEADGAPSPPRPTPHNLPFRSLGGLFKGRVDVLASLGEGTAEAITAVPHTVYGLGGVGKTRLAVEFAWRNLERYRAALFVVAESSEKIEAEVAALAGPRVLGLLDREQMSGPQQQIVDLVLKWLRTHPGWLLIFDNVDGKEAAAEVEGLLPLLTAGHVLITSRLATWGGEIRRTALDTIPLDEAEAFLLERTDQTDAVRARELAERLGKLPLALEQAAAYMQRQRWSVARYLTEWSAQREKVLAWHDWQQMKYPASVATTWETTFELLGTAARTVLRIAAHLAPEPMAREMFEEGAEVVAEAHGALCGEVGVEVDVDDALAELADFSMITLGAETFTLHRLVQEVTRSRIEEEHRKEWVGWALRVVHQYAPGEPQDVQTWGVWDPLRPHAGRVLEHSARVGDPETTAMLLSDLGLLLKSKALHAEAEPLMRRALELEEASYGPQHRNVAIRLNNLAQVLKATNRLAEAEPLMRRALKIDEAHYGPQHTSVATHLNNLATLLQATNRLAEAEPLMRRALKIDKAIHGRRHPKIALRLNNLAQLLKDANRLARAEPLMRRALEIDEAHYGPQHPNVAIRLNNLAMLLKDTNRLAEAEPLMRRALEIGEASYGPRHPKVALRLNNLAQVLKATNRLAEAEPLHLRALAIDEAVYGPQHPKVGIRLNDLALLLQATNRLAEAEPLMRRALKIFEASLGPEHPWTQISQTHLDGILRALKSG